MKPTVLVDCDGVLADFAAAALKVLYEETGHQYSTDAIKTWEIFDSLPEPPEVKTQVYDILKGPGGCSSIPVYPGALEGLRKLKQYADIIVVTSPFKGSATWAHEREEWLENIFGDVISYVVHTHHKERIHGEIFIDDKVSHVIEWGEHWGNCPSGRRWPTAVLWAGAMQIDTDVPHWVHQVKTWDEVLQLVPTGF